MLVQRQVALLAGADHDPVLTRTSSMLAGMLAGPPEVFADPDLQRRLSTYRGAPRYAVDGPTRAGLPASSAVQVDGLLLGASIEIDAVGRR